MAVLAPWYCHWYCLADLREAARVLYCAALAAALGRPHDPAADLTITLSLSHPDAAAECTWLAANSGGSGGKQRRGRHNWQQKQQQQQQQSEAPELPVYSTALLQRLAAMPQADFAARCPADAARLTAPAVAATVQLQALRKALHVGGRCGRASCCCWLACGEHSHITAAGSNWYPSGLS